MEERKQKSAREQLISESDRGLLHSILEKDNKRIKQEIKNSDADVVFKLGFEGGGLEITQYRTPNNKVYFRTSGTSMTLDDNDDEEWIDWEDEPVASFEGALAELRLGTDLLCITPILVHPDFRPVIRNYVDGLISKVTVEDRNRMGNYLAASSDEWISRLRG